LTRYIGDRLSLSGDARRRIALRDDDEEDEVTPVCIAYEPEALEGVGCPWLSNKRKTPGAG